MSELKTIHESAVNMSEVFPPIKNIPIAELIPYARNSRTHSDEQVAQIAASIREFGFLNPIIIDGNNGIIAGHGRVMAAQRLGIGNLPCVDAGHLSDAQRRAYVIADNKLALNAGWDVEMLKIELSDLELSGFDISITGFSDDEIQSVFDEEDEDSGDVINDVDVSELPHSITNPGDVWIMGRHRVMCGDSSNVNDIEALLDGKSPEILMYDPPYEIEESWTWFYPAKKTIVFSDYKHVKKAMKIASNYEHVYQFVWDNCTSWYTPNRPLARHKTAFFCSDDPAWDFDAAIYQDGKERKAKKVRNSRGDSDYSPLKDGFVHLQTVYQEPNTKQDSSHAHAKPVKWLNALMRGCGGGLVLDLFGGSGASIIAAPDSVDVYCMEIDAHSCDKIIDRWQRSTGETAVLATPST